MQSTAAPADFAAFQATAGKIAANMEHVISGKPDVVRLALAVLLAEGHLLLEDVPGVGKTQLAKALARSVDCGVNRIQFTPDLLPGDVTGVSVWDQDKHEFTFKPGAVFSHLVIGDEINRASPKTQAALLECMEERQVTVDGSTYGLASPFMVIATQNPIDMEGTYPLPEAQRDRFTARATIGYPDRATELRILNQHGAHNPLEELAPVCDAPTVARMILEARSVHVSEDLKHYTVSLVAASRQHPHVRLGASPRASLQLLRCARAWAALEGRHFVLPDDIQRLAGPVLAHRLVLTAEAAVASREPSAIVSELLQQVPVGAARAAN
ncbi:AAA family ATPase [Salininema proteolyticum]|uniref:AAA family ATPase n=1 Tax=Salininema proteolyticum TaxID=1607685 RepID=A0ABV8TYZ2_9ACTN